MLLSIVVMSGVALMPQLRSTGPAAPKLVVRCSVPAPCAELRNALSTQGLQIVDDVASASGVVEVHGRHTRLGVRLRESSPLGRRIEDQVRSTMATVLVEKTGALDYNVERAAMPRARMSRELAVALIVLLYFGVQTYGLLVASSVVEEKNSRTVDLLLSAVSPRELLWGKLLGIGLIGLLQSCLVIGGAAGVIAIGLPFLPQLVQGAQNSAILLPDGGTVALMIAFFVLGYFSFGAIFTVLGAVLPDPERVRQYALVLYLPLYAAFYVAMTTTTFGPVERILSEVPLLSPMIMFARFTLEGAPLIDIAVAVGLSVAFIIGALGIAVRLYSVESLLGEARRQPIRRRASA